MPLIAAEAEKATAAPARKNRDVIVHDGEIARTRPRNMRSSTQPRDRTAEAFRDI